MSTCQQCGLKLVDTDLVAVTDLNTRVAPGEPMPSGQCPECGALCQPDREPLTDAWLERLLTALNSIENAISELRVLVIEADAPPAVFAVGGIFNTTLQMFKKTLAEEMGLVLIPETILKSLQKAVLAAAGDVELGPMGVLTGTDGSDDEAGEEEAVEILTDGTVVPKGE